MTCSTHSTVTTLNTRNAQNVGSQVVQHVEIVPGRAITWDNTVVEHMVHHQPNSGCRVMLGPMSLNDRELLAPCGGGVFLCVFVCVPRLLAGMQRWRRWRERRCVHVGTSVHVYVSACPHARTGSSSSPVRLQDAAEADAAEAAEAEAAEAEAVRLCKSYLSLFPSAGQMAGTWGLLPPDRPCLSQRTHVPNGSCMCVVCMWCMCG